MARIEGYGTFQLLHRIEFRSVIRGHHVYKTIWTPIVNEKLFVRPDEREEALEYDKYSIGIFKKKEDGKSELVGHAPQELSSLIIFSNLIKKALSM